MLNGDFRLSFLKWSTFLCYFWTNVDNIRKKQISSDKMSLAFGHFSAFRCFKSAESSDSGDFILDVIFWIFLKNFSPFSWLWSNSVSNQEVTNLPLAPQILKFKAIQKNATTAERHDCNLWTFMNVHEHSWLPWTALDCRGLPWTFVDCRGLSWTAIDSREGKILVNQVVFNKIDSILINNVQIIKNVKY